MTAVVTLGVVGAGAMGRGIAELAARSGFAVRLHDAMAGAAERAVEAIGEALRRDVARQRLDASGADAIRGRLSIASLGEVAGADLVIEAIVEDLAAKQDLFRSIDAEARPDAILATNTSSLSVARIADAVLDPGRLAGLHFFNPPTRMRVVEIVRGPLTRDETVAALEAVAARLGQRAFLVADTPGFLVNHLGRGYVGEALRLLDEGVATPAEIDAIAKGALGFRMGPFELLDLTGLDVTAEVTRQIWKGFGEEPRFALAPIAERRVTTGFLGRKTGRGFYEYDSDGRVVPSPPEHAAPVEGTPAPVRLVGIPPDLVPGVAALFPPGLITTDPDAVAIVGPIGTDTATEARRHGLDPRRTVGIDPVFTGVFVVGVVRAGSHNVHAGAHGVSADLREVSVGVEDAVSGVVAAVRAACGAVNRAVGRDVIVVRDDKGMPAQRLAAMIVLIAAECAARGISIPADIDAAPRLALAWPRGPLELGDMVGASRISAIAAGLHALTGEPRWRPSPWLDARARTGKPLAGPSQKPGTAPN